MTRPARFLYLATILKSATGLRETFSENRFATPPFAKPPFCEAIEACDASRQRRALLIAVLVSTTSAFSSTRTFADDSEVYNNPNIPPGPVERSGLVVLRVAEVAQYQEKLIRAILNKDIDVVVSPQQIVFGTQILLRNSNIAGNMKLMIDTEVPRERRREAAVRAAKTMNTIQAISATASKVDRAFTELELLEIADLYRDVRLQLNALYEHLPPKGKDKYYGYFMAVTEYEKKIADGTYNPELDGILQFDDRGE